MSKSLYQQRQISRRESLKGVVLVPVGAVAAARWLGACGEPSAGAAQADTPSQIEQTTMTAANAGSSGALGEPGAANAGSSSATVVTTPRSDASGPNSPSMNRAPAAQGGAIASSAGTTAGPQNGGAVAPAANGGVGGSAQVPTAGATGQNVAGTDTVAGDDVPWASGGTKSMAGPFPDPFEMASGATCRVYPAQTLGPCYANSPAMREDISDGAPGLPTRLSFHIVRSDGCTPVPGAIVDIWHSGFDGVYSAFGAGVCNPDSLDVANEMFCRGVQTTDETGRAHFSTIFPGWYSSRAVHIHFTVRVSGTGEATSQLYFDDDLTTEIQAQGEYAPRGMRPTTNTADFIFRSGGASAEEVTMVTAKRPDGSLHAWKVIAIG